VSPVVVVVAETSSMIVRRLVRGHPRQFIVMKLNRRCSILVCTGPAGTVVLKGL